MILIFIATLVIALIAQWHVKRAYARHSRTPTASGYTGAEVAAQVLRQADITNIDIVEHGVNSLSHFPKTAEGLP